MMDFLQWLLSLPPALSLTAAALAWGYMERSERRDILKEHADRDKLILEAMRQTRDALIEFGTLFKGSR